MPDRRHVGYLCICGKVVLIPEYELAPGDTLEALRDGLRQQGWSKLFVHSSNSPGGCHAGTGCTPEMLGIVVEPELPSQ